MKHIVTAICYDKRGRILSIGRNSYVKTHPLQAHLAKQCNQERKIFLHAEVDAIIKAKNWELIYKMTVVRLNKAGQKVNAKPCAICQEAIKLAGIKRVEHT